MRRCRRNRRAISHESTVIRLLLHSRGRRHAVGCACANSSPADRGASQRECADCLAEHRRISRGSACAWLDRRTEHFDRLPMGRRRHGSRARSGAGARQAAGGTRRDGWSPGGAGRAPGRQCGPRRCGHHAGPRGRGLCREPRSPRREHHGPDEPVRESDPEAASDLEGDDAQGDARCVAVRSGHGRRCSGEYGGGRPDAGDQRDRAPDSGGDGPRRGAVSGQGSRGRCRARVAVAILRSIPTAHRGAGGRRAPADHQRVGAVCA